MTKLIVTITVDDVNPSKNYGQPDDQCTKIIEKFHKETGAKFTFFVPSNWKKTNPISKNRDWISFWLDKGWVELSAHGHYHSREVIDPSCRDCEFVDIYNEELKNRVDMCLEEWQKCDFTPLGWRMPGWRATQESFDIVSKKFKYLAIHGDINKDIRFDEESIKIINGQDPIHSNQKISVHKDNVIYFQSHIFGEFNSNNWDETNYEIMIKKINFLKNKFDVEFKLLKEVA